MPYRNIQDQLKYAKSTYKRVPFDLRKDYYEETLKPAADRAGEPVNMFIKKAIAERIERLSK